MSEIDFIQNDKMQDLLKGLKKKCKGKAFSDIVDGAGNQYVDLVMEGGGVLGVALVGYTYVLEEMGIRFLGVGGTSAGSINALFLTSLASPAERKSEKVVSLLSTLPMREFVDGDSDAKDFIDSILAGAGKFKLGLKGIQILDNIFEDLGLNPGKYFQQYISGILRDAGIVTTRDLNQRLAIQPAGLRMRDGKVISSATDVKAGLAVIAADVSTETKVEFPKMAPLYWENPDEVDPALYIRASMSIPYFFQPFRVRNVPTDEAGLKHWRELASYTEIPPRTIVFVDGGVMSNFPIDLFHKPNKVPTRPTFGVKLGSDQRQRRSINSPQDLAVAVFNAARHCLDFDFITRNPDYKHLVTYIDTEGHHWLNFDMEEKEQIELFTKGAEAAADFLCKFDWEAYKEIRQQLILER